MSQRNPPPTHPSPASGVAAADDAAPATVRCGLAARAVRAVIRGYQLLFSAWVGGQCRFYPTCSAYAMEAVDRHGAAAGSYLMVARLCRCQPWCEGGLDPVPAQPPRLFRHLAGPSSRQTRSEEVRS